MIFAFVLGAVVGLVVGAIAGAAAGALVGSRRVEDEPYDAAYAEWPNPEERKR
jgi:hypothetical protein